jgi:hypothetical protein
VRKTIPIISVTWLSALLLIMTGCTTGDRGIPSADEFKIPAIGTLFPGLHEESIHPTLAPELGGIVFVNQSGVEVKVAVSSTIATLPAGSNFLFILPPDAYRFYVYPTASASWAYSDTVTAGSLRYVYLPFGGVPGANK